LDRENSTPQSHDEQSKVKATIAQIGLRKREPWGFESVTGLPKFMGLVLSPLGQ
jgi:hypothetical protein